MIDLRGLSRKLDSDMIRQEGLHIAIEEYIAHLRKSVTGEIIFKTSGRSEAIPVDKVLILFRIIQEAINNILKHSEASLVVIELVFSEEELKLEITDNGRALL